MKKTKNELEEKLNEVRKEILILETLGIKPNFSELSRKCICQVKNGPIYN